MEKNKDWLADGTFDIVPKLMKQLYTIHIIWYNKVLPLVYAYLPIKKTETYKIRFELLKKNLKYFPISISVDFEKAVFKAVINVFQGIIIFECFLHFSQNIFKRVIKYNLKAQFNSRVEFRKTFN